MSVKDIRENAAAPPPRAAHYPPGCSSPGVSTKVSPRSAYIALINLWDWNPRFYELSDGLIATLREEVGGYIRFKSEIRGFIGHFNVLAANAMWDGQRQKALLLLTKHGLKDRKRRGAPRASYIRKLEALNTLNRVGERSILDKSARRAWTTCKP